MTQYSIFIVDDEKTIREGIALVLENVYRVRTFMTAEAAIEALSSDMPDLILLDIGLPGMNGIEALEKIKAINPEVLVIMITAYEDSASIISAMKLGAHDYVVKPIMMDGLEVTIRNALETIRLRKDVQELQEKYLQENLPCFVAESNAIQDVMELIFMVAKSPDTPVLILGETGTGKELVASAIHYRSPNFKGPFVPVNCAAIPQHLLESELFGYEKGAFSGANPCGKKGLIEEAEGGTLFLDEVGDLSLEAQAKLLRFLEEGEFYHVGGTRRVVVKTRLVSATNRDLDEMMEDGTFRTDLFFRLGVIKVKIPSLNERSEDIVPMAESFLTEYSKKFKREFNGISNHAKEALLTHKWKGNVRELRNIIERAVLIGKGAEITAADLGLNGRILPSSSSAALSRSLYEAIPEDGMDLSVLLKGVEKYYIDQAFERAEGNESEAARLLNMNHHTYRYHRKGLK